MFKINSDPKDKFQPILLRDWSKGMMTDVDPYDAPQDALAACHNLRYLPGKLTHIKQDLSEQIGTVDSVYSVKNLFFHQSTLDDNGSANVTDFHYYHAWYPSPAHSDVWRSWDDGGGWDSEIIGAFTTINNDTKLFQSYGDTVDVGQGFYGPAMNIQHINRARFNTDHTLDAWYASEVGMITPTVNNTYIDSGADNGEIISDSDLNMDYSGSHSLVVGDYIRVENEVMRITSDSGTVFGIIRGEKGTTAAGHTFGDIYAGPEADYRLDESTIAVEDVTQTTYPSFYTENDVLEYAFSYLRDGGQESALTAKAVTATVASGNYAPKVSIKVLDGTEFEKRVTSIRIYHRLNKGEWYFMGDVDIEDGLTTSQTSGITLPQGWTDSYNCHTINIHDIGSNSEFTFTYFQKSGFPLDNESTSLMYKVSTTHGNRRIVANVEKNGTEYPGRIYISVADAVNTFPDNNYLDLIEDDQTAFTALVVWNRILFAFKADEVFIIDIRSPNESSWRVMDKRNYGVSDFRKVVAGTKALYFATETGIVQYTNDFKRITDNLISSEETDWSLNLGFDFQYDELVVDDSGTGAYVFDKYGRWWTEDFLVSVSSHWWTNNADKELIYLSRSATEVNLTTRQGGTTEKSLSITTHPVRPGPDNDFILRRVRVRFYNPDPQTFTLYYKIDNGSLVQIATGNGTLRGTGKDRVLEWTGKTRFKAIEFQFSNHIDGSLGDIKEIIAWVTPRKGRRNA